MKFNEWITFQHLTKINFIHEWRGSNAAANEWNKMIWDMRRRQRHLLKENKECNELFDWNKLATAGRGTALIQFTSSINWFRSLNYTSFAARSSLHFISISCCSHFPQQWNGWNWVKLNAAINFFPHCFIHSALLVPFNNCFNH